MAQVRFYRIVGIIKQCRHRFFHLFVLRSVLCVEMLNNAVIYMSGNAVHFIYKTVRHTQSEKIAELVFKRKRFYKQKFRHHQAVQFVEQQLTAVSAVVQTVETFTGGDIRSRQHNLLIFFIYQCNIIVLAARKCRLAHHRTRRNDFDYFAFRQSLSLRVADLLTDGYFIAAIDELVDIRFGRMVRHAAHRYAVACRTALCQRKFQLFGNEQSVIHEHFIEITQTEKQYLVGMSIFYCLILLHHRSQFQKLSLQFAFQHPCLRMRDFHMYKVADFFIFMLP